MSVGVWRAVVRSLAGVSAAAVMLVVSAAPAQALEQRLIAADGGPNDFAGYSVDVDGDTAVMGALNAGGKGAVYVFTRTGDTWAQTAKLTTSDLAAGDDLGSSVAIDGDTIVAGATGVNDAAEDRVGAVYTFARTGAANRQETAKLTASDGDDFDNLGFAVAIDGDAIVAGASTDEGIGGALAAGSLYTFTRTGAAARTETGKLRASTSATSDQLGRSLAIDGDTIVAGADIGVGGDVGKVLTFARSGASPRTETAVLTASDAGVHELGKSVAIDGDTIVAGAPQDAAGGSFRGSVYTFARTGAAARTETAKLTASDAANNDFLGSTVAIDGDTIYAGAPFDEGGTGSVYTFARTGAAARTETGKLTAADGAPNDRLATFALAVDGDTIVAGAHFDDVGTNVDQGSAVVFYASEMTGGYADAVLADTPAGYWRFGEPSGLTALDSSGNANNGTYTNGPVLGVPGALAGDTNTAVSMDGVNDTVRVPDANSLDVGNTFSAEGWIKRSSTAQTHTMMVKGFQIVVMNAGSGSQVWLRKPNVSTIARTNVGVGADVYHYIVVTKNGSGAGAVKIYIDGVSVPVVDVSPAQVIADTTGVLAFGAAGGNQANFDEFALYDSVLTPEQVAAHFAAG